MRCPGGMGQGHRRDTQTGARISGIHSHGPGPIIRIDRPHPPASFGVPTRAMLPLDDTHGRRVAVTPRTSAASRHGERRQRNVVSALADPLRGAEGTYLILDDTSARGERAREESLANR